MAKNASAPRFRAAARREVILSTGSLNTPQLLNISGIGAKDELEKFGIEVVKDLPAVGKNLYDVGSPFSPMTAFFVYRY